LFGVGMEMDQLISKFITFLLDSDILNKLLIYGSFLLLILITMAVIYISYISWKDKKRVFKK